MLSQELLKARKGETQKNIKQFQEDDEVHAPTYRQRPQWKERCSSLLNYKVEIYMETVQAFMQRVTHSSSASSQQNSALSQAITDFGRIMHDTQTKTLSGIETALESHSTRAGAAKLHKLVKAPEVFAPSTWDEERKTFPDFHRKFKTWLSAIEPRFGEHTDSVEKDTGIPLITAEMTPRTEAVGKKLYAVLTSYTKGRRLRTISKVPGQNGFEAYRLLVHENMPKSQVPNFHLLQNIINFKSDSGRNLNENVLAFEQLVEDYEKISNVLVGSETKLAVMIANAPADVQEPILLNYDDKKSYGDIRDYMLSVERNKRWTKLTTKEKRQTTTDLIESGQDHGGQADMDINQVKGKGKGKSFKGKGKGKGKSNWESGYGKGRGYKGRGRGFKGRGKGRGFGRGFGKGGGKYNHKGSRKKGLCNCCQKPGHYEAECRLKQRDMRTGHTRQVQEDQQSSAGVSQAPATAPSTTTATTQQTRATNNTRLNVRQIDMWHIGDEPDQFPESFVSLEVKKKSWRLIISVVYSQCVLQQLNVIACVQKMKKMQFPWICQIRSCCGGVISMILYMCVQSAVLILSQEKQARLCLIQVQMCHYFPGI